MAPDILKKCVTSSVLSHGRKTLKWQTSVTALLQLTFIQQAKDSTPSRYEGGPPLKEKPPYILASSFYTFVSSTPWAYPMQIWLAKKGMYLFHLKLSLWVHGFSFVPFSGAYPFLCSLATTILDSFFFPSSNYLKGTVKDRNDIDLQ